MVNLLKGIKSVESLLALALFILAALFAFGLGGIETSMQMLILALLGIVVGFMTIRKDERLNFVVAVIALSVISFAFLKTIPSIGGFLEQFFINLLVGFGTVTLITVVIWIWEMTKSK